jgi:hypothetical protein
MDARPKVFIPIIKKTNVRAFVREQMLFQQKGNMLSDFPG